MQIAFELRNQANSFIVRLVSEGTTPVENHLIVDRHPMANWGRPAQGEVGFQYHETRSQQQTSYYSRLISNRTTDTTDYQDAQSNAFDL